MNKKCVIYKKNLKHLFYILITVLSNFCFIFAQNYYPSQIESVTGFSNLSNISDFLKQINDFNNKRFKLSIEYIPSRFELSQLDNFSLYASKNIDSLSQFSFLATSLNNNLFNQSNFSLKYSRNLNDLTINTGLLYNLNFIQNYRNTYNINFFIGFGLEINQNLCIGALISDINLKSNSNSQIFQKVLIGAGIKLSEEIKSDVGLEFNNNLYKNLKLGLSYQIIKEIKTKIGYSVNPQAIELGIKFDLISEISINFSGIYYQDLQFNKVFGSDFYFSK